jgi:hypothetical protein
MPDLPFHIWYSITSLGSAGLTLPLAIAIALWLALGYSWRMAAGWLLLLGAAIGVVTVTKLAFLGWGVGVRELDFTGVSGHAMLSTAVYPVALFLMLLPARPALRLVGVLIGLAAGIAVGLSRVVLDAHSPSEAITGCIVGALTALMFVRWSWDAEPGRLSAVPVTVSLVMRRSVGSRTSPSRSPATTGRSFVRAGRRGVTTHRMPRRCRRHKIRWCRLYCWARATREVTWPPRGPRRGDKPRVSGCLKRTLLPWINRSRRESRSMP